MSTPPLSTAPHPTDAGSLPVPTAEQVTAYRRDGFLVVRDLVPAAVLDAAERGMQRFYAGDHDRPFPGRTRYDDADWSPDDGPDVLRKNDYASRMVDELATLVTWPGIARFAAELAGASGIRLWHDQLLYKPPAPASERTTEGNVGWRCRVPARKPPRGRRGSRLLRPRPVDDRGGRHRRSPARPR
jgi:hypothetical protein